MPAEQRLPVLRGERLLLRPASGEDAPALARILAEPDVARWFGEFDLERVRREMLGDFVIVVDGAVAGWLGFEEEDDPDYRHVALDIALAAALHGRGYGPEALLLVIRHFVARGHHRFTIDPAATNQRAIRAYRAVGFRPVGVLRAYERTPGGGWHDGLLMDLLADELAG
jgi:aminoglycoside 6'-N-acetyltransferase